MQEIRDLVDYLKEMEKMSEGLSAKQKKQLATIMASVLTLIVSFKRDSGLDYIQLRRIRHN